MRAYQASTLLAALQNAAAAFEEASHGKSKGKALKALAKLQKLPIPEVLNRGLVVSCLHLVLDVTPDLANTYR